MKSKVRAALILGVLIPISLIASVAGASIVPLAYVNSGVSERFAESHLWGAHPSDPAILRYAYSRTSSMIEFSVYVRHINANEVSGNWERLQAETLEITLPTKPSSSRPDMFLSGSIDSSSPGASHSGNDTGCTNGVTIAGGTTIDRRLNRYIFRIPFTTMAKCGFKSGETIVVYTQSSLSVDNQPYSDYGQKHPLLSGGWWTSGNLYRLRY